jgi:hypothetical protein
LSYTIKKELQKKRKRINKSKVGHCRISANNVVISGFTIANGNPDIGGGGSNTLIIGNNLPGGVTLSSGSYQTITQNKLGSTHIQAPYTLVGNNTVNGSAALVDLEAAGASGYNCVVYLNSLNGTRIKSPATGPSTALKPTSPTET